MFNYILKFLHAKIWKNRNRNNTRALQCKINHSPVWHVLTVYNYFVSTVNSKLCKKGLHRNYLLAHFCISHVSFVDKTKCIIICIFFYRICNDGGEIKWFFYLHINWSF